MTLAKIAEGSQIYALRIIDGPFARHVPPSLVVVVLCYSEIVVRIPRSANADDPISWRSKIVQAARSTLGEHGGVIVTDRFFSCYCSSRRVWQIPNTLGIMVSYPRILHVGSQIGTLNTLCHFMVKTYVVARVTGFTQNMTPMWLLHYIGAPLMHQRLS